MSEFFGSTAAAQDTPIVDLNGKFNGDATGFTVVRFTPGEVEANPTFLSEGEVAGGEQVEVTHPPVRGSFELTAEGSTDIEELRQMFSDLAAWLDTNAVLVVQPDGQTEPIYYDTYRSSLPSMYTGGREREGVLIVDQLLVASYTFEFWHHPHPRTAGVTLATGDVSNGAGGPNVLEATNPGSAPSEGRLSLTIAGSEHVVYGLVGIKEGPLEFPSYAITGAEPVFDAWQMLHRQVLTPSDPAAFAGSYRAVAVYTAAEDIFHFQMLSGTSVDGPQAVAGVEVEHDWTDVSNFAPTLLDLGEVRYDARDPRLVIEIWGRSEGSTDVDSFDALYLIPADQTYMELAAPGFLSGVYGLQVFDGSDLTLVGTSETSDDGAVMLGSGDTATIPAVYVDGNTFPVGRHQCEFRGTVRNKDRTREKMGELQVIKNGVYDETANVFSRRGEAVTRWDADSRRTVSFDVTDPDDHYDVRVNFTESGGPGKRIHLTRLRMSYIPWVTDGRAMVVDQGRRESFIADDTGATISKLHRTAALYLPSGDMTLACLFGVQGPNRYDGVDRRGNLPVISDVTAGAVLDVTPRRLHP